MRIAYCTNVRLPNERAHGYQIAKVTEALAELGHDVEVFAPFRRNPITESFQAYYGLKHDIPLHHLRSVDGIAAWWAPGIIGLKVTTFLFGRALRRALRSRRAEFDLLYTRTPELLPSLRASGVPIILELHRIPRLFISRFLRSLKHVRLVVALTAGMRAALVDRGVTHVPIVVEGDAVDLRAFANVPGPIILRRRLQVPGGIPLIGYAGQLQSMGLSKGIPELLRALSMLHKRGVEFRAIIAGGPEPVAERFRRALPPELAGRVTFTGFLPHADIPALLSACDVLVYPAPAFDHPFYARDTSPLKIFEYMAAGKPIVAADLPPIREILDDTMVFFSTPGDAGSLAAAMREAVVNKEEAVRRALSARKTVGAFTWRKRMERIMTTYRPS